MVATRLLLVMTMLLLMTISWTDASDAAQEMTTPSPSSTPSEATPPLETEQEPDPDSDTALSAPEDTPTEGVPEPTEAVTTEPMSTPTPEPTSTATPEPTTPADSDEPSDATDQGQTPEPTATVAPVVTFTASVSCVDSGDLGGRLTVKVQAADATITDIVAVRTTTNDMLSVGLDDELPRVLEPGTESWPWDIELTGNEAPDALLVRVAELPGTAEADALIGDDRTGWLLVPVTASDACFTPTATETAIEQTSTPTPAATVSPDSDVPPTNAEPSATATETASDADSESGPMDAIVVEAMDATISVIPGSTVDQRFQVRNTSDTAITVQLSATTSSPAWNVRLVSTEADGNRPITEPVVIDAHDTYDLMVRISIPYNAYVGDQSSIGVDVQLSDKDEQAA